MHVGSAGSLMRRGLPRTRSNRRHQLITNPPSRPAERTRWGHQEPQRTSRPCTRYRDGHLQVSYSQITGVILYSVHPSLLLEKQNIWRLPLLSPAFGKLGARADKKITQHDVGFLIQGEICKLIWNRMYHQSNCVKETSAIAVSRLLLMINR